MFGKKKLGWLKTFLELPNGIPSYNTFGRVFALLDSAQFRLRFMEWVQAINELTQGQVVAVDGKPLRGSGDSVKGRAAIKLVSAWASANQVVLGQMKVEEGSNEITAIPELLRLLEQIVEQGGDYLLAVKENQGRLYEDLHHLFQVEQQHNFQQSTFMYAKQVNMNHERLETRRCWATSDPEYLAYLREGEKWSGLKTLAMINTERRIGDKIEVKTRYFISSLAAPAKRILKAKRSRWSIEN
ncbi:MAG: hypothetical protein Kow0088_08230 [Anaerolineales bacterium]